MRGCGGSVNNMSIVYIVCEDVFATTLTLASSTALEKHRTRGRSEFECCQRRPREGSKNARHVRASAAKIHRSSWVRHCPGPAMDSDGGLIGLLEVNRAEPIGQCPTVLSVGITETDRSPHVTSSLSTSQPLFHMSLIASPFLSNKPSSLHRPHRLGCRRAHRWYHPYPGRKIPQHQAQARRTHSLRSNADLGLTNIARLLAFSESEAIYIM